MTSPLLTPYRGTTLDLPNRIAMAPLTRTRADDATGAARPVMAEYYAQRASAGLIVSEGIWPHPSGKGGPRIPGLSRDEHIAGWRPVTEAVHARDGRIFAQLWHVGRVNHPVNLDGDTPVAPSAIAISSGQAFTKEGMLDFTTPRALSRAEIGEQVRAFGEAARRAVTAGFDGVEIHGANGYLLHQFLSDRANRRTDDYAEPTRFAVEVVEETVARVGAERVGLRISPDNTKGDVEQSDWPGVYRRLLDALNPLGLAFLHARGGHDTLGVLRSAWQGTLIGNHLGAEGLTPRQGEEMITAGLVDVVAFGRAFLANPDLPERIASGAALNAPRPELYYAPGAEGYTDYPTLATSRA